MTGDERLAKVAEVLAGHRLTTPVQCSCGWRETDGHGETHSEHLAQALAPLLDEFRAEDEARALRAAADALEAGARTGIAASARRAETSDSARSQGRRRKEGHKHSAALKIATWLRDRAALAAAEPAPRCAECGPGYRIGDEGCRHGTAAAEPDAGER